MNKIALKIQYETTCEIIERLTSMMHEAAREKTHVGDLMAWALGNQRQLMEQEKEKMLEKICEINENKYHLKYCNTP